MKDSPLVSVIMPAYNAERTIAESIKSVLLQSHRNWELIIINDGSKDGTEDAVRPFLSDDRIKLQGQVNQGIAAARNHGLRLASGSYIAFLDSDDLWKSEKLTRQIEFMRAHPDKGLVYSGLECFYTDITMDAYPFDYTEPVSIADDYHRLLVYDYIATLTVMITREAAETVGLFDTELFGTEDWDYWIRIARIFPIGFIPERLAYYREHPAGVSKNRLRLIQQEYMVIDKQVLNSEEVPEFLRRLSLWVYYKKRLQCAYKLKEVGLALRSWACMIKTIPLKRENYTIFMKIINNRWKNAMIETLI